MQRMITAAIESDAPPLEQAVTEDGFRQLVERYHRPLYRLAYRMTMHQQDAEDLVQETFFRAYRNLHRFEQRANVATWLYRICSNATLDLLRKRKMQALGRAVDLDEPTDSGGEGAAALASPSASPERLMLSAEKQRAVTQALEGLTPVERAAFSLRHYEQLSIAEIGAALGLREAATKNTIFRGVKKLRRALVNLQ